MLVRKHSVLFLFFVLLPLFFIAQTEAEMKIQADKLFDSEQYIEATPLYLRLLSLKPRDLGYNYKYGTCLLFNSNKKQEAIKYLSFAVTDPAVTPDAYYFLGKALHLNYQFNEAIKQYTVYIQKRIKGVKSYDAEREIEMCQNGKRLMTTISDIIVLEKKELTVDKFFRVYELKDIGGNLLVTTDFQTKIDKKNNHVPLIHFPQNPTVIYYSSYGENGNNGKDIYVRRKLPDGSWGMPQPIPGNVNTKFDEDFPYMHPDGNYLYFSSKGHNSMGGYDVFRSKYDPENNSYGPPENMDFAISSPDDDLFYVVDSLNANAYFASARQSEEGKLFVYKVKVDRVPIQLAVIKGNFLSEIDPKIKKINFEIKDFANGENIGKFNSNDKAVYLITFPKGGKYEFIMTVEGSNQEFRSIVSIPFMKEFKPLKQKIVHTMEEGREIVKIVNLFNEEVDDPQAVIAEVIKMRSNLNVNVKEFDLDELEQDKQNKEILKELGLGELMLVEVEDVLKQQVKKGTDNQKLIENIGNNINNLVVENSQDFVLLEEQIKSKVADANKTENVDNKYKLLSEAQVLIKQQEELKKYSKDLLKLNDSIKNVLASSTSGSEQQKMKSISDQFEKAYRDGNEKIAIQIIADNKEFILKVLNDNSTDLVQNLVDKIVRYDEEISAQKIKVDGYNREIKELEIGIQSLENSIYSAKKKDVPAIEQNIASKKEEIALIEEERNIIQKSIDKKTQEKFQINQQIEVLQDAISNKSIVVVSKEQAKKAIFETEKTNSNTLITFVNKQIEDLEKQDPTLKDRIVISSGLKAQNIFEEYRSSTKGIEDDPSLSKEEKLYKLLANERNALKLLDKRLDEINDLIAKNTSDDNIIKEKQALQNYKKEIGVQIAAHEKQVEVLMAQKGVANTDKLISSLQPEYDQNKKFIESNINLSKEEKLESLNIEDQKLLSSVDKELATVTNQLAKDPSNKTLQGKQKTLETIKSSTQNAIDQRNKELQSSDVVVKIPSSKDMIAQLDPKYEERKEAIEANSGLSKKEKLEALNREDEKLLVAIEKELSTVSSQLAKDPSNKTLQGKQNVLETVKASRQNAIDQRNKELQSGDVVANVPSSKEMIAQLDPKYEERKEAIEANSGLSEKEKLEALNREDEKLLVAIEKELSTVSSQLAKDPSNKTLQGKQNVLETVKASRQNAIDQRNKELQSGDVVANVPSSKEMIAQLDPKYEERKEAIEANSGLSEKEKLEALNREDAKLLVAIEKQLSTVLSQLAKDPSNKTLQGKQNVLETVKASRQNAIDQRNKELQSGDVVANVPSSKEMIAQLDPKYEERKEAIEANSGLSEKEKLEALNREDEKLLVAIEKELSTVSSQLAKDPSNKTLQGKQNVLETVKASRQNAIDQRNKELQSGDVVANVPSSKEMIAQLDPKYEERKEAIEANSGLSEKEKLEALNREDEKLLVAIEKEQVRLNKELKKDPTNKEIADKISVLAEVKSQTEKKISERETTIASLSNGNPVAQSENKLIEEIKPGYAKDVAKINANESLTNDQKMSQLQVKDKELIDVIDTEISSVEKQLVKDPENTKFIEQKEQLEELRTITESKTEEREQLMESKLATNLTAENVAEQKNILQNKLDPSYQTKKEAIQVGKGDELNKKEAELKLEQAFLGKINAEENAVRKILNKDPFNQKAKTDLFVLGQLKTDSQTNTEKLKSDIEAIKSGVSPDAITTEEKVAVLNEIDPEYTNSIKEIKNSNEFTSLEKTEEQLKVEKQLSLAIEEKQEIIAQELASDPENKSVLKEKIILESIQNESEDRIELLEKEVKVGNVPITLSQKEKEAKILEIRPEYAENVDEINDNKSLSTNERLNLLQTEDQVLLGKIYDKQEQIEEQLERNPSSKELKQEQKVLTAISSELEVVIDARQNEINSGATASNVRTSEKNEMIDKLFPSYTEDKEVISKMNISEEQKLQQFVDKDRSLLTKINAALIEAEAILERDPGNSLRQKEKEVLETLRQDIQNSINENQEKISDLSSEIAVTTYEKNIQMDRIDSNFSKEKQSVETNKGLNQQEQSEQLLALENDFLDKVRSRKFAIQESLDADPTNAILKKDLAVLKAIEKDSESSIEKYKTTINESGAPEVTNASKEQLITEVFPDYETRKENLVNSKMSENKKVEEKIKLENELLSKLQSEKKVIVKQLAKDPEDKDLQLKLIMVDQLIAQQNEELVSLKEQKAIFEAQQETAEIVTKSDPSYLVDIERLESSNSESKNSDLAEREIIHQDRLSKQIEINEKALAKKETAELKQATEILKNELVESKGREENFRQGKEISSDKSEKELAFISTLREDLLQNKSDAVTKSTNNILELKDQDRVLSVYEKTLIETIKEQEEKIANEPKNGQLKEELVWVKSELNEVQTKRRKISISIGGIESELIVSKGNERFNDPVLNELEIKEAKLLQKLESSALTKKEEQIVQKELTLVQKEKTAQENTLLTEALLTEAQESKVRTAELNLGSNTSEKTQLTAKSALIQQRIAEQESMELRTEASKTKNPEVKNFLLREALLKQEASNNIVKAAIIENSVEKVVVQNGIQPLVAQGELEKKKRTYSIQIGELTQEIQQLDTEIKISKGKEAAKLNALKSEKVEQRAILIKQLENINEQLSNKEEKVTTINDAAMNQDVSYNEERQIAMTEEYKNYNEKAVAALEVEKQITSLDVQLTKERTILKQLVAESVNLPNNENKTKMEESIARIQQQENELQTLQNELSAKQKIANQALPAKTEEAMKMQNLVKRGIQPIARLAVVAALVPLPASGIEIKEAGTNVYSAEKPIPVDVKNPTGLVYRVQVGAFAKPIPQDLFNKFNPVSGEKLNNSNITRYMAGYFNSSSKVVDARDQIKALGYMDAFAVAYCDGERITLAEARILEANGQCTPIGENELIMEVATNTAIKMGLEDTLKKITVPALTYNQAPGAVKAEPIEVHKGLFFTVQVGVYNRPVSAQTVKNIAPLMTLRLPNGQIRYSAGIFNSIDAARPKKLEAIEKGVKDAFITAYYNGERITLGEAQKLLDERGMGILDNNITKPVVIESNVPVKEVVGATPVETYTETVDKKKERIQIITKKTFEEFPREVLNRYNSHGSFYYDETDKKVKSAIASSVEELPQVYYFKDDIDTLYILDEIDEPANIISVTFVRTSLPGDFIDWLLRYNYRREFTQSEETLQLLIYRIPDEKLAELESKLDQFGLSYKRVKESERE